MPSQEEVNHQNHQADRVQEAALPEDAGEAVHVQEVAPQADLDPDPEATEAAPVLITAARDHDPALIIPEADPAPGATPETDVGTDVEASEAGTTTEERTTSRGSKILDRREAEVVITTEIVTTESTGEVAEGRILAEEGADPEGASSAEEALGIIEIVGIIAVDHGTAAGPTAEAGTGTAMIRAEIGGKTKRLTSTRTGKANQSGMRGRCLKERTGTIILRTRNT